MKNKIIVAIAFLITIGQTFAQNVTSRSKKIETTEHYTFELSDKVVSQKVNFKNRYGNKFSGDLYLPKNIGNEKFSALVISGLSVQ